MPITYLGKTVSVTNGNASLTNGAANWNYNLGTHRRQTTLTVTNASGKVGLYRRRRNRPRATTRSPGTARTITATSLPTAPTR